TTRLHISPLTPALLDSVLAPSVRASATDISFHTIQTFPENSYGYVTLPAMEADKLKKKLNGSILKGKKFKVEVAHPKKRHRDEGDDAAPDAKPSPEKKVSKKRKAEEGTIEGYELPPDRQVKRGWTEPAHAKKEKRKADKKRGKDDKKPKAQAKSKYTDHSECLFRTKTPPNRTPIDSTDQKKKSKKKSSGEVVVHEFEKSITHPSFIRSGNGEGKKVTTEFVEGKGWVDSEGNVIEPVNDKIKKPSYKPGQKEGAVEKRKPKESHAVEVPGKEKPKNESLLAPKKPASVESSDESESDWTSSSGTSSNEEDTTSSESEESVTSSDASSDEETEKSDIPSKEPDQPASTDADNPAVENSAPAETERPSNAETEIKEEQKKVHPLEALFKRPANDKPALEVNTQFTFFGGDNEEEDNDDIEQDATEPLTPFTKKDLQMRAVRSAAPTPDTALASRTIFWNNEQEKSDGDEDDDNDDNDSDVNMADADASGRGREQSEFEKWFWEHRGENNRAWKRRRRQAAKEKRQSENRKKGLKGRS
ncbi:suppressor protein SRP40, partial [Thermoascus aurantiacus ATCC 26904]